jgi:hypothetical protein
MKTLTSKEVKVLLLLLLLLLLVEDRQVWRLGSLKFHTPKFETLRVEIFTGK